MAFTSHGNKLGREVEKSKKLQQKAARPRVSTSEYQWDEERMRRKKLRRVLKSSGPGEARSYAAAHNLTDELRRIAGGNDRMALRAKKALGAA